MKRAIISFSVIVMLLSAVVPSYASDWDKAGKALAIIEGARILTGGNVDIIGNITGINRGHSNVSCGRSGRYDYAKSYDRPSRRVWVPHYVWKKKYIPEHEEYDPEYGTIIVEGHYIEYRVEDGGHWEYK
jgi:hypothetical protein